MEPTTAAAMTGGLVVWLSAMTVGVIVVVWPPTGTLVVDNVLLVLMLIDELMDDVLFEVGLMQVVRMTRGNAYVP